MIKQPNVTCRFCAYATSELPTIFPPCVFALLLFFSLSPSLPFVSPLSFSVLLFCYERPWRIILSTHSLARLLLPFSIRSSLSLIDTFDYPPRYTRATLLFFYCRFAPGSFINVQARVCPLHAVWFSLQTMNHPQSSQPPWQPHEKVQSLPAVV